MIKRKVGCVMLLPWEGPTGHLVECVQNIKIYISLSLFRPFDHRQHNPKRASKESACGEIRAAVFQLLGSNFVWKLEIARQRERGEGEMGVR